MKQLFDAKLWIKRDLSHFIQKKKKKKKKTSRKSDTLKQLKSCSKHDIPHLSYGDGLYPTMTNWQSFDHNDHKIISVSVQLKMLNMFLAYFVLSRSLSQNNQHLEK